jgi:hypothetical protein
MERNFYNDDFEQFLKQKADQYKMYSSDRVWNNIYSSLHNRRKWLSFGLLLLLIGTAFFITRQALLNNDKTVRTVIPQSNTAVIAAKPVFINEHLDDAQQDAIGTLKQTNNRRLTTTLRNSTDNSQQPAGIKEGTVLPASTSNETELHIIENTSVPQKTEARIETGDDIEPTNTEAEENKTGAVKEEKKDKPNIQNESAAANIAPVRSKWSIQLYASPIVSYRRLNNLNNSSGYVPVAANYGEKIDNYVHHKPAIGFEMGTKMQYAVTSSLSFYAGVQLNYSRYYIDAYNSSPEKASITLSNSSLIADTVSDVTTIRNFDGNSPEQLQNQYFQVSIPVGGELKIFGGKRLAFSVAGSVQPTYLIGSSSYLISSDFKNYIQSSDLTRRFNIHTNFEAFISYKTSTGLKWQLGPQFRYQVLSSYSNQYPVREYLMEYGVKLGISKTLR